MNFTILDISGSNPAKLDIETRESALEIVEILNKANPGTLWVVQQNV